MSSMGDPYSGGDMDGLFEFDSSQPSAEEQHQPLPAHESEPDDNILDEIPAGRHSRPQPPQPLQPQGGPPQKQRLVSQYLQEVASQAASHSQIVRRTPQASQQGVGSQALSSPRSDGGDGGQVGMYDKYIFGFPKYPEWSREYNELVALNASVPPGAQPVPRANLAERYEALRSSFRDYLFQLKRYYLSQDEPLMVRDITVSRRVSIFMGLRMNIETTIDFEAMLNRMSFVRKTISNILLLALHLKICQPLNGETRGVEDVTCELILRHMDALVENCTTYVYLTWQHIALANFVTISGNGLPRSFENQFCPILENPIQQYIHYIMTCIKRNNLMIDFKGNVYMPRYASSKIPLGTISVNTHFYCRMLKLDNTPYVLSDLVHIFSKTPAEVLPMIKGYKGVNDVDTGKFSLSWNELHASLLSSDLTRTGKNKGQALANDINANLKNNPSLYTHFMPNGKIVFSFKNLALQATPILKCIKHVDMPVGMRAFQFFDQDIRPEVVELVEEYAVGQNEFADGKITSDEYWQHTKDVVDRLRLLTTHLESCMLFQNWEKGTIYAFYAFVLPQMICRKQWNHTNDQIESDIFESQPSGLMVVFVGITGSGKTVLAELINFVVPDEHRVNLSLGGGQKDFQLTSLAQKPHALSIQLPDARESLVKMSKELVLQVMGSGGFTIDVKYGLPLEYKNACLGMLACTNDQSVEFCKDEYSDGSDKNASERRVLIFVLNNTHVQTKSSTAQFDQLLRTQVDSYVALSFILFNTMRQLYVDKSIYDMVCGKYEEFVKIFGTQLAEFKQNINNNGDVYRKMFLMSTMFISRADKTSYDEDEFICIPMQVLVQKVNAWLRKNSNKKQELYAATVMTYLDRIFNDPKAAQPMIRYEKHRRFLWRGRRYDDEIVYGITLSFDATERPMMSPMDLDDLQMHDAAEHAAVVANIEAHEHVIDVYSNVIGLFIKHHVTKHWQYTRGGNRHDEYYGVHYKAFVVEFQKWIENTCYAAFFASCGGLFQEKYYDKAQEMFHECGWTDVTISDKTVSYGGVRGSLVIISNVVAITKEQFARPMPINSMSDTNSADYSDSGASATSMVRRIKAREQLKPYKSVSGQSDNDSASQTPRTPAANRKVAAKEVTAAGIAKDDASKAMLDMKVKEAEAAEAEVEAAETGAKKGRKAAEAKANKEKKAAEAKARKEKKAAEAKASKEKKAAEAEARKAKKVAEAEWRKAKEVAEAEANKAVGRMAERAKANQVVISPAMAFGMLASLPAGPPVPQEEVDARIAESSQSSDTVTGKKRKGSDSNAKSSQALPQHTPSPSPSQRSQSRSGLSFNTSSLDLGGQEPYE